MQIWEPFQLCNPLELLFRMLLDGCEGLMFTLVHAFVAPTGSAEQAADVGAGLPSDIVDALRVIKGPTVAAPG